MQSEDNIPFVKLLNTQSRFNSAQNTLEEGKNFLTSAALVERAIEELNLNNAQETLLKYDQFIKEQLAGDLLKDTRRHPEMGFNESVLGTAFLVMTEGKHSPVDMKEEY